MFRFRFAIGRAPAGLLLAGVLVAAGCGMSGKPSGRVEGTVSVRGQPVTRGNVNFLLKDKGVGAVAPIDATGKYAFEQPIEAGTYLVSVTPLPPEPSPPGKPVAQAPRDI